MIQANIIDQVVNHMGLHKTFHTIGIGTEPVYEFNDCYVSFTDSCGYPSENGKMIFFKGEGYGYVSVDFVLGCPLSELNRIINIKE